MAQALDERVTYRNVEDQFGVVHRASGQWTPACRAQDAEDRFPHLPDRRKAFPTTSHEVTCLAPRCRR